MGIFAKIKDAIFGHHETASPATGIQDPVGNPSAPLGGGTAAAPAPAPAPTATQPVDVEATLERIAQEKGNPDLNWRTSIVDLMKLLGLDSSLDHRKQLATELGYTGQLDGSVEMNMWLHREVMRQLAANGGTVPPGLMG
jgi:dihydroorotase-like cyclic amidohydrolase